MKIPLWKTNLIERLYKFFPETIGIQERDAIDKTFRALMTIAEFNNTWKAFESIQNKTEFKKEVTKMLELAIESPIEREEATRDGILALSINKTKVFMSLEVRKKNRRTAFVKKKIPKLANHLNSKGESAGFLVILDVKRKNKVLNPIYENFSFEKLPEHNLLIICCYLNGYFPILTQDFGEKSSLIDESIPDNYYAIHYAGSDIFAEPVEISCISILHSKIEKTVTFSRTQYGEIKLLKEFFNHLKELPGPFITWNWKDSTYGLPVITKRYRELVKEDIKVDHSKFYDLDALFEKKYGRKYVSHPKLQKLAEKNELNMIGFQLDADESVLFDAKKFRVIEISCNLKVRIIHQLVQLTKIGELEVAVTKSFHKYNSFLTRYQPYRKYLRGGGFISFIGSIAGILQDVPPFEFLDIFGNTVRWILTVSFLGILTVILFMEALYHHYKIKD
ncbi:MAG: hypothetical protein ACFFD4_35250 [Candidatus Odinarchaeota archaeon]